VKRRLFNIFSALSLALALTIAGIWCYTGTGSGIVFMERDCLGLRSVKFVNSCFAVVYAVPQPGATLGSGDSCIPIIGWLGVFVGWLHFKDVLFHVIGIDDWLLIAVTLILPAFWLWTWRRQRQAEWRLVHGYCPACGYDLRGSKERCPECGIPIPAKA
jgi:hypothetical protein